MSAPVDPGDPFTPGTPRYRARAAVLACVDALLDDPSVIGSTRWRQLLADLREARRVWALYGRDGE